MQAPTVQVGIRSPFLNDFTSKLVSSSAARQQVSHALVPDLTLLVNCDKRGSTLHQTQGSMLHFSLLELT